MIMNEEIPNYIIPSSLNPSEIHKWLSTDDDNDSCSFHFIASFEVRNSFM